MDSQNLRTTKSKSFFFFFFFFFGVSVVFWARGISLIHFNRYRVRCWEVWSGSLSDFKASSEGGVKCRPTAS